MAIRPLADVELDLVSAAGKGKGKNGNGGDGGGDTNNTVWVKNKTIIVKSTIGDYNAIGNVIVVNGSTIS
jgi:hypothetical protein